MTVIAASTLTLKPGAYPAFLEQHGKAKAMLERLGARNVRLMGSISGDPGAIAVSMEFDDYASGSGLFVEQAQYHTLAIGQAQASAQLMLCMPDLRHDLARCQVAREALVAGRTKTARES